jgi:peptide/nickel transport system substrate-binding protein
VIAAAALGGVLVACSPAESDETRSLSVGVTSAFFAGQYQPTSQMLAMDWTAVYETLLRFNPTEAVYEPLLATSFEFSEDRKTVVFTLRDDVDFSDGTHLTAEAAATALNGLIASLTEAATWAYGTYEAEFAATGEYELTLTSALPLSTRLGDVFSVIMYLPVVSPAFADDLEALAAAPAGTGPYLLDEVTPEVSATFVRNPEYWNPEAFPFDDLEIVAFADTIAGLNALKSGQVDAVNIDAAAAADAENAGLRINTGPGRMTGLWIGDRAGAIQPALADVRVREAIGLAFDREAINDSINQGFGTITNQPFLPSSPEYVEAATPEYDPERARELLAEAGYADGFDITIPSTTFLGINAWEPVVTQYLGDIGVRVTFEPFADIGAYFTAAQGDTYAVLMYSEDPTVAMEVYFLPRAVFAYDTYDDDEWRDLADTMATGTLEESAEATSKLGELVVGQAWFTVFAAPETVWASREDVVVTLGAGPSVWIDQFDLAD